MHCARKLQISHKSVSRLLTILQVDFHGKIIGSLLANEKTDTMYNNDFCQRFSTICPFSGYLIRSHGSKTPWTSCEVYGT